MKFLTLLFLAALSQGATIVFNAIDSGNYRSDGAHRAVDKGYIAGRCSDTECGAPGGTFRDFFVFDLTALAGLGDVQVTDAIFTVANPLPSRLPLFNGGYNSPNLNADRDRFEIFDVTTGIAQLRAAQTAGAAGAAIYADLGGGPSYSSYGLTKTLNTAGNNTLVMVFGQDGVNALNNALDPFAAASLFAFGGRFMDLDPNSANQYIFRRSDGTELRRLTIEYQIVEADAVPEPSTFALSGLAFAGFLVLRVSPRSRRWRVLVQGGLSSAGSRSGPLTTVGGCLGPGLRQTPALPQRDSGGAGSL
jgi:hypothetical protein